MTTAGAVEADAQRVAALALAEDGPCDVTSDASVVAGQRGVATIEAREPVVLAGFAYVDAIVVSSSKERVVLRPPAGLFEQSGEGDGDDDTGDGNDDDGGNGGGDGGEFDEKTTS